VKIALGMIIKSLESETELLNFISNAEKYGHKIDCVIVAFTQRVKPSVQSIIDRRVPLITIDINNPSYSLDKFRRLGISDKAVNSLLRCPVDTASGLVPYSYNRNLVVIEAILREMDVLFFVDSDVYPSVLSAGPEGFVSEQVDFFGAHLEQLSKDSVITTGEYSGYNILPPAKFEGMDDLLKGIQKDDMTVFWQESETHKSLTVQPPERIIKPCTKILGGNVAIKLSAFSILPPFFSSYYSVGSETYLCRGEDTMLGVGIEKSNLKCTDVSIRILHDTYKNYPNQPDLKNNRGDQDRFYYACTGWIGRNPFLNHLLGKDLQGVREYQRAHLVPGLKALAKYTSNPRFLGIEANFDESWNNVDRYISEFEEVQSAWREFIERMPVK